MNYLVRGAELDSPEHVLSTFVWNRDVTLGLGILLADVPPADDAIGVATIVVATAGSTDVMGEAGAAPKFELYEDPLLSIPSRGGGNGATGYLRRYKKQTPNKRRNTTAVEARVLRRLLPLEVSLTGVMGEGVATLASLCCLDATVWRMLILLQSNNWLDSSKMKNRECISLLTIMHDKNIKQHRL